MLYNVFIIYTIYIFGKNDTVVHQSDFTVPTYPAEQCIMECISKKALNNMHGGSWSQLVFQCPLSDSEKYKSQNALQSLSIYGIEIAWFIYGVQNTTLYIEYFI